AVADALQLQNEILPLADGLQVAGAVLDVEPALLGDAELRFLAGMLLPAGQVLTVEDGFQTLWLQLDIPQSELGSGSGVKMNGDRLAAVRRRGKGALLAQSNL